VKLRSLIACFRNTCPICHSHEIRFSRRKTTRERFLSAVLYVRPFRCRNCWSRFWKWEWIRPQHLLRPTAPKSRASAVQEAQEQSLSLMNGKLGFKENRSAKKWLSRPRISIPVYVNTSEKTSPANSMARISRQIANETVEKSSGMRIHINDSPRLDLYRSNTYTLIEVGVSHGGCASHTSFPVALALAISSALCLYARNMRLFSPFGPSLKNGLTYSQTNSSWAVTSKRRPKSDSQIKVLPFGKRCALDLRALKNSHSRPSWYFQTICLVANSTSITRENGME
jgi:hypothetical protein